MRVEKLGAGNAVYLWLRIVTDFHLACFITYA